MPEFFRPKSGGYFFEHHNYLHGEYLPEEQFPVLPEPVYFLGDRNKLCIDIRSDRTLHLSYYIGLDWITSDKVIFVQPKLNKESPAIDYLSMLFSALKHPEVADHTDGLYEIKFDKDPIHIEQEQDALTPLLIVHFLQVIKRIVKKGLKKSCYKTVQNLNGKIKGKILIGKTIKENRIKNDLLNTMCTYEEFGLNNPENRFLKKALMFIRRYCSTQGKGKLEEFTDHSLNYILPAFQTVSEESNTSTLKHYSRNAFYKEYDTALKLAKIIMRRFGYNISVIKNNKSIHCPPFWIDMSKLFELYCLGLLKDRFGEKVKYHFKTSGNELDFLLNSEEYKMVIDSKYKPRYVSKIDHKDVRQVSGYARLKSVHQLLGKKDKSLIDCAIVYPDQKCTLTDLKTCNFTDEEFADKDYNSLFKIPIKLPEV